MTMYLDTTTLCDGVTNDIATVETWVLTFGNMGPKCEVRANVMLEIDTLP